MSEIESKFGCDNDCEPFGFPGHTMRAVYHSCSDTVMVEVDGKPLYSGDMSQTASMLGAIQELLHMN